MGCGPEPGSLLNTSGRGASLLQKAGSRVGNTTIASRLEFTCSCGVTEAEGHNLSLRTKNRIQLAISSAKVGWKQVQRFDREGWKKEKEEEKREGTKKEVEGEGEKEEGNNRKLSVEINL